MQLRIDYCGIIYFFFVSYRFFRIERYSTFIVLVGFLLFGGKIKVGCQLVTKLSHLIKVVFDKTSHSSIYVKSHSLTESQDVFESRSLGCDGNIMLPPVR